MAREIVYRKAEAIGMEHPVFRAAAIGIECPALARGSDCLRAPPAYSSNIACASSRVISTWRGLAPSASETMPRWAISSISRPALA